MQSIPSPERRAAASSMGEGLPCQTLRSGRYWSRRPPTAWTAMPPFRSMTGITRKLTGVITSRPSPTILIHEWVTGGGMADTVLPPSWAAEGSAMRRAIAGDFAALEGGRARVIVTLDARLDDDPGPWTVVRIEARQYPH